MSFDPYLFVAFGAGIVAGRLLRWRSVWVGHAATVTVALLLFLLGLALGSLPLGAVLAEIPLAVGFAAATLGLTVALARLAAPDDEPAAPGTAPTGWAEATPVLFLACVVVGGVFGHTTGAAPGPWTEYVLYALLALVGFDLMLEWHRLRSAWVPIGAAAIGGLGVGTAFALLGLVPPPAAFATASAFGWYSLAGPLVGARLGAGLGLFAFLANFLRENATMLTSAYAGRRLGGRGLAAMGGATSMDTTLYFITRYGGARSATVALATGIVLTLAAAVLVPLALTLA